MVFLVEFFWIAAALTIILLFRPLFLLCLNRGALFLMLSKSIVSLVFIFLRLAEIHIWEMMEYENLDLAWLNSLTFKICNQLSLCIKLHVSLLALNRLHAMFRPMTYSKFWLKKRLYLRIWLILCPGCCAVYFSLITFADLHGALLSMIPLFFDTILPLICYGLLFFRILKERRNGAIRLQQTTHSPNSGAATMEKDRIRMCVVFFSSSIPHCLAAVNSALQYILSEYNPNSDSNFVFTQVVMANFVLSNGCVEELVLLLLCRDFRILLKQQFVDFIAYWTCRGLNAANTVVPIETISTNNRTGPRVSASNWAMANNAAAWALQRQ